MRNLFENESRKAGFQDGNVCPKCYLDSKPRIGTPLSELSGQSGYEEFCRIAKTWGYD